MAINESVYGAKSNWVVPYEHIEQNETISAEAYYYNTIAEDDNLKIKVANYNTVSSPTTTMHSQMVGEYPSADFVIRNNWDASQTESIDPSIVQFGIGSQSGLANQEWWFVEWTGSGSQPSSTELPVLKNTDSYDIVNMTFAFKNVYVPTEFFSWGTGSILTSNDNSYLYQQQFRMQTWGNGNSAFDPYYSASYGYRSGSYLQTQLVTQIPIKNLKVTPVIFAYKSDFSGYKRFDTITSYLSEKSAYPYLMCLKAQFRYRSGFSNATDYDYVANFRAFTFNKTSAIKGYNYTKNSDILTSDEVTYYNRIDRNIGDGITVAGRYGYSHGRNGSILGNEIYWTGHTESSTQFTVGEGDSVLQTPDFHFTLDNDNGLFYCDISQMTNDQITEGIRTQLASFGLFFVDGINDLNLPLDDEKTFLGILEDGVAYGKYSNGSKNREQDQWNWDTMEENSYDPSNPPKTDPNTYESTSGFNPAINAPDGFNKRYVLSEIDIRTLREDFFKALESKPEDIDYINFTMSEFLTNNPIECIVSLKWFPFTVPSHGQEVNINLGNYQTNVQAPVYTGSGVEVYSLGSCVIYPYAGSGDPCFLDYAPYTKMELIVPYCGTVELDPSIYMNHTLSVNFIVDIYTGACTAYIMCDGLVSDSVSGVCCVDLPISGIDNATLEGQIYNASLNLKSSKIGEAVSVVSGGLSFGTSLLGVKGSGAKMAKGVVGTVDALTGSIGSVAQSSESLAMNQYQIEHINIPFRTVGSQTGLGNAKQEQFCRLLIYRPKFINGLTNIKQWYNSNEGKLYGHTVGYSCIKTDVISSFHGFTMFSNVDLSGINATDAEKSAILTALQSGVILP